MERRQLVEVIKGISTNSEQKASKLSQKKYKIQKLKLRFRNNGLHSKTTALWDRNSNTYPNKQLKQQLWENIAAKLNMDTNACMWRWKALREKYIRQKTKFQIEGEKWELLDEMSFLDKVIHYRRKRSEDCYQTLVHPELPPITYKTAQRKEPTTSTEIDESHDYSNKSDIYEEDNSLNDSSNDLVINVKHEDNPENMQNSFPDSSSRKRAASFNSDGLPEKMQKSEEYIGKSPEELFGNLVAAMLRKKPEKDRNSYMIEIMTVLSK